MKTLYYLLLEYLLILRLQLRALWQHPPARWNTGKAGNVVLIPGFGEPWTFLAVLAGQLNARGYRVHVVPKLNYNTQPIVECVDALHSYITQNALPQVILLAHSRGGIAAKLYADAHPEHVQKIISLSTPYQGTLVGYLYICNLKELIPNSPVIQKALNNTAHTDKILNLSAQVDNHVVPNAYALLPGATNQKVPVVGHTRILEAPDALTALIKFLHT
ncbi:MAG: hypothetical protein JNK33_03570 [Candidatus Doudnabacteria bacterium]|nr:hypothetical protein [Candidatus Doudnabacteria bacterium]